MSEMKKEQTLQTAEERREALFHTMRTAFLTAYPKIFTDVAYASEIFYQSTRLATDYGFSFQTSLFVADMAIEIEARHKALNAALKKEVDGETLIIELAVGLSPRRAECGGANYVELDHETIVEIKKSVYEKMGLGEYSSGLHAVDFTDRKAFSSVLQGLNAQAYQKIVVVSEGLFWYLKRSHVQAMVEELSAAFAGKEWCWVTADCPIKADVSEADYRNVIANSSGRSPIEPFADYEDFAKFFTSNGFTLTVQKLQELISPQSVGSGKFFSVVEADVLKRMDDYTDIALLKKA